MSVDSLTPALTKVSQQTTPGHAGQHLGGRTIPLGLAATYAGGHPLLLERILPLVDYIEVTPDSIAECTSHGYSLNRHLLAEFKAAGATSVLVHGVGLSMVSAEGISANYLHLLDEVFDQFDVIWHSELLACTVAKGEHLNTMVPPRRTRETLDLVCERVIELRRRFPVPFLLENVVRLLPDSPGEYSEAEFLNELVRNSGCGLILDVYNLEYALKNHGFNAARFLDELDMSRVVEVHVGGSIPLRSVTQAAPRRLTRSSTIAFAGKVLPRTSCVQALTYEYVNEAVPHLGYDSICDELDDLRRELLA